MSIALRLFACHNLGLRSTIRIIKPNQNYQKLLFSNSGPKQSWGLQHFKNQVSKFQQLAKSSTVTLNVAAHASSRSKRQIGYWLAICGGMVFGAVVLGGVTRLTKSGLSMVTWRLLGEKLPRSNLEWEEEFNRYKQYPEFKLMNRDISLQEFKWIWYMEYIHRSWGRALGAVFLLPATIFWATGKFSRPMKRRVLFYGTLIGLQGLMGWYMVKSGLEDRFENPNEVPRVSQYRLAAHLSMAFLLYAFLVRSAMHYLIPAENGQKIARGFRSLLYSTKGLVFLTAISGAFVAGIDAGLVCNSWPKMGDHWIPEGILNLKPTLKNFTENPVTTQFDHRMLAYVTLSLVTGVWYLARRQKLPKRAYHAANAMALIGWMQLALGITTLLTYVPVWLAACHQSGSLLLLTSTVWLSHEVKKLKRF